MGSIFLWFADRVSFGFDWILLLFSLDWISNFYWLTLREKKWRRSDRLARAPFLFTTNNQKKKGTDSLIGREAIGPHQWRLRSTFLERIELRFGCWFFFYIFRWLFCWFIKPIDQRRRTCRGSTRLWQLLRKNLSFFLFLFFLLGKWSDFFHKILRVLRDRMPELMIDPFCFAFVLFL